MWEQLPITANNNGGILSLDAIKPVDVPKGSNLPAKTKSPFPPAPRELKVATIVLFLLAGLFSFVTYQQPLMERLPFTEAIYNVLGLSNTHDIAFNDMRAQVKIVNNKLAVTVTGRIANESGMHERAMQPVHIYILSEGDNVMGKVAYQEGKGEEMPPESFQPFKSNVTNVSGNASRIVMDIGNWLERLFR